MRYPVFRPPYVYRWAVLLTVLTTVVTLAVAALQSGATGSPTGLVALPTPLPAAAPTAGPTAGPTTGQPVPAELLRHATAPGRVVALTFDDGPHPQYTPQVLDLLARYGAVATFCVVGEEADRHPELVREIAAAGMALCSHTVSHDENLPGRTEARIRAEVLGGRDAILAAAGPGAEVPYFRAPAGNWSALVQDVAAAGGLRPLSWSVDSRDWQRPGAAQILGTVQQAVHPGAVVLLHDGGGRRDQTVVALGLLLPWLVEQGYTFAVP